MVTHGKLASGRDIARVRELSSLTGKISGEIMVTREADLHKEIMRVPSSIPNWLFERAKSWLYEKVGTRIPYSYAILRVIDTN